MKTMPDKLSKAASRMMLKPQCTFFATMLCSLNLESDSSLSPPTMSVNATTIFYHPQFVEDHSIDELIGVLCHEVMHVAMLHPWRRGDRQPKKANMAMDYEINGVIEDSGLVLPSGRLRKVEYDGKAFETIYSLMPDDPPDGGKQFDDCRQDAGSSTEQQQAEAEMKVTVQRAANIAKAQGQLPGRLAKLVAEILEPKVNWREALRQYMSTISKADQSWNRRQKRFQDIYLPALYSTQLGRVVVGVDTSGSVYAHAAEFLDEVRSICEECKPSEIVVVQCDATVTAVDTYAEGEPMTAKISGGGGTDLRKIFEYIDEHGIEPEVLIVLTDLETPHAANPPDYPVIWVSTEKHVPPFGVTIYL